MASEDGGLRVGAGRAVITPPLGVSLAGSYTDRRAIGLHDDLYARAFVVDGGLGADGSGRIALVSCDLIGLRASTVAGARRLIEQACGIPADGVLIAATHNHSGPLTRELFASGLAGEPDEPYLAQLERQIASAVQLAWTRRSPARLRLSLGQEQGIAFNRRFHMREGPVLTNPGKQHPHIMQPAAPVDERVWTVTALPSLDGVTPGGAPPDGAPTGGVPINRVSTTGVPLEGAETVPPQVVPLGVLVSFGLHPAIVAGTIIGGDFPAYLEAAVQRLLGSSGNGAGRGIPPARGVAAGEPVVVFANAPCGDINHVDVSHPQRQGGFAEAARVGTILAAEVCQAACRLVPDWELAAPHGASVRGARRVVELPLRRPTPEQAAWARQAAGGRMTMVPGKGLEVVEAQRILSLAEGWTGPTHATEVQALAIGDDLSIVGLPGEIFAELGLSLRERSPFRHTLVLGLANEAIGYVPTRRAYDEGGYEPAASRLEPGGGERLVDEALALLTGLHRRSYAQ